MKTFAAIAVVVLSTTVCFSQERTVVVGPFGNTTIIYPSRLPIQPYGLNLEPANVPERASPYTPRPKNPGAVTIENPYYREPEPEPTFFEYLGTLLCRLCNAM